MDELRPMLLFAELGDDFLDEDVEVLAVLETVDLGLKRAFEDVDATGEESFGRLTFLELVPQIEIFTAVVETEEDVDDVLPLPAMLFLGRHVVARSDISKVTCLSELMDGKHQDYFGAVDVRKEAVTDDDGKDDGAEDVVPHAFAAFLRNVSPLLEPSLTIELLQVVDLEVDLKDGIDVGVGLKVTVFWLCEKTVGCGVFSFHIPLSAERLLF